MEDLKMHEITKVETVSMINLSAIDIQISGMTCSGCAGRVEKVLSAVYGVDLVSVNLATEKAHIIAKSGERLNPKLLISVATKAGYPATYINYDEQIVEQFAPSDQRQFLLLLLSIFLTMPFMVQMILMPTSFNFNIHP
jgi:Cu+-exporting ATPase